MMAGNRLGVAFRGAALPLFLRDPLPSSQASHSFPREDPAAELQQLLMRALSNQGPVLIRPAR